MLVARRERILALTYPDSTPHLHSQKARSTAQEPNSAVSGPCGWKARYQPSPLTAAGRELALTRIPPPPGQPIPLEGKTGATGNQKVRYSLDVTFLV